MPRLSAVKNGAVRAAKGRGGPAEFVAVWPSAPSGFGQNGGPSLILPSTALYAKTPCAHRGARQPRESMWERSCEMLP